ncbi:hypothetical protein GALMADRAFT_224390 [Galerina marginata CBS 339.88]|uniref:Uncharacterized protein n=1 Tax=Galerina marginata (strain CBS 339.88) TaxID=685588 RepID=A0A067T6N7_GALM3|nr:hypothetical protein GALMADRAFT_224390 [Galerina marginata CBS 339.88]
MHFTALFTLFASFGALASATPLAAGSYLMSDQQLKHWLATTDADITYIGKPINPLSRRQFQQTTVVYCTDRIASFCGGTCNVYTGGPICLEAAGTNCLSATNDVGFCDQGNCGGSCNEFAACGTKLSNNFCDTPGTNSIAVGA